VHGSFFGRQGLNTAFGYILGVLVFTSFEDWRYAHLRHHVTYANLDARGFGDIWTMTLTEYENSSKKKRLQYRLYRNPFIMLGLGAMFTFFLANRLPTREVKRKQRLSVLYTNLLIIAVILIASWLFGWRTYLLIQVPVFWFAGAAGGSGCFTSSISFPVAIGPAKVNGSRCGRPWKAVRFINYRRCCDGSPETSATTMSTI